MKGYQSRIILVKKYKLNLSVT